MRRSSAFFALSLLLYISPTKAESEVYLSLFFVEKSKGMNDYVLLTDGRTLSVKKGKIRPPAVYVISEWSEFYNASYSPPKSAQLLEIKESDGKASICFTGKCEIVNAMCPRIQLLKTGNYRCLSFPSLLKIKQE